MQHLRLRERLGDREQGTGDREQPADTRAP
jgi:hypothetical protein